VLDSYIEPDLFYMSCLRSGANGMPMHACLGRAALWRGAGAAPGGAAAGAGGD
jgi:hypothetical protein